MAKEALKEAKTVESNAAGQEQTAKREVRPKQEAVYPAKELAANAREIFDTRQEVVIAALKAAGRAECTVSAAKEIVEKFLKKEVR